MPRPDPATADPFEAQRLRLLRLAYRMLASHAEAEDVVQDAWLRWARAAEAGGIDSPAAWLTRTVTRLCLDRMKSARVRRESYVGEWLPDPWIEAEPDEARADEVTLTLMLALERLSPLERAAFLLHDVFDVQLGEVAAMLEREPAAVRQLASRARRHVRAERPRFPVAQAEAERLASAFFAASREGDTAVLRAMLAEDVALYSDGGGKVLAFRNPIHGIEKALRLFSGLKRKVGGEPPELLRSLTIDGLPGFVSMTKGRVLQTTALDIRDGRIVAIYMMRNPDKLRHIARALGL